MKVLGFLWRNVLKPVLKGVSWILERVMAWSWANPEAALGVGLLLLIGSKAFQDMPYLASAMAWTGGIMMSTAVTSAVVSGIREATESVAATAVDWFTELFLGPEERDRAGNAVRRFGALRGDMFAD